MIGRIAAGADRSLRLTASRLAPSRHCSRCRSGRSAAAPLHVVVPRATCNVQPFNPSRLSLHPALRFTGAGGMVRRLRSHILPPFLPRQIARQAAAGLGDQILRAPPPHPRCAIPTPADHIPPVGAERDGEPVLAWVIRATSRPLAASHTRTVSSPLPLTTYCPSGLNVTADTSTPWVMRATSRPLAASHTRAVLSPLPLTIERPSGLNATAVTSIVLIVCRELLIHRLGIASVPFPPSMAS